MIREIVTIDGEKCDGCGLCVPACHEGAIRIENGKARLVADRLCDGLGACLGHCPKGAICVEKREAEGFDEQAVAAHLAAAGHGSGPARHAVVAEFAPVAPARPTPAQSFATAHAGGCPSQRFARLHTPAQDCPTTQATDKKPAGRSELGQWPIQLRLLPPRAPVFQGADLLLAADCVAFALAGFQEELRGRAVAIACPKLDETSSYVPKLTEIIAHSGLRSITVLHMEVPCCTGILMMALQARAAAGVSVPIEDVVVSVRGDILSRRQLPADA